MSDTSEFAILIKTKLEDAGIKATDEQVKGLAGSLEDSGKKGQEAHEKITDGAHKAELSHHELREAVHAVAGQFGGLADVGLWLNPMTAGLAATLFLVDKLKEHFTAAAEAVSQLAEQTDKINEAKIKGFAEAANSAAESLAAMAVEQEKLNTAYAQSSTAMDNRLKQYSAERDAVIKVAEAKEGAFEAEIHYQTELGNISKERGEAIIAQSKLQLDAQRGASDSAKLEMEIEERKQELAKAHFRTSAGSDMSNLKAAQKAEETSAANADASEVAAKQAETGKFQSSFTNSYGVSEGFNGTVEDLKKRIAELREDESDSANDTTGMFRDRYKHDAEALEVMLENRKKYVKSLQDAAELDKQKLAAAKALTEAAAEQKRHDEEILRTAQDQIDVLQKQLDLQKQVTREVEEQHRIIAGLNAATATHQEQTRVQSGKGTAQEQSEYYDDQAGKRFAGESGPQASIDASALVSRARELDALTRGQGPQALAAYHQEIHEILTGLMGVQRNGSAELNSQRRDIEQLKQTLSELESRYNNNRSRGY